MEDKNEAQRVQEELEASQPIETNYPAHQEDPAPSEEAVKEENEDGAGKVLKWIIPAAVIVLALIWFFIM